ncbi:AMP-binding protein [Streptomyces sp. NBC_01171]|uniref:AMP-binding protein n=1 Tax=Streptomyces sp. NBC_01171 TaxID=2903757 RepID=UPI00386634BD|nr:hypothetical protein OG448_28740 [Streptomyces sp. NBC_01171]
MTWNRGTAERISFLVTVLKAAFPKASLMNGYGMTETASLITLLPDRDAAEHVDSVGYPVPAVDLGDFKVPQYVSVAGEPLPRNAGGELLKKQLRERVAWGAPLR